MRILARRLAVLADAVRLVAASGASDVLWLDSGLPEGSPGSGAGRARWSVVGFADGPFSAELVSEAGAVTCTASAAAARWFGSSTTDPDTTTFGALGAVLAATPHAEEPIPGCGFALGWIGYLGYELGRESGGPPRTADGHPDLHLRFVDRAVVLDHELDATWVLALVDDAEPTASARNATWVDGFAVPDATTGSTGPDPGDAPPGLQAVGRVPRAAYERAVDACRAEIRNGNAFQVCLTTAFAVPPSDGLEGRHPSDPPAADPGLAAYRRLRAADPVPFGCFLRLGPVEIAGRSPERFLRIGSDGRVLAEPIKGTRPRGVTPESDAVLREDLRTSAKDRAENVMIVDLLRNDLLRTAVPGSVHVERLCAVETYASVHQMVSTIAGVLPDGASRAEVVRAAFPPGSMTGAPKISAMAIADRLEGAPRGVYSGVVGYFSTSGAVDLAVTIRTLVTVRGPSGEIGSRTLGAGGAVTWSSSAAGEADEVETKTRSVLGAMGAVASW